MSKSPPLGWPTNQCTVSVYTRCQGQRIFRQHHKTCLVRYSNLMTSHVLFMTSLTFFMTSQMFFQVSNVFRCRCILHFTRRTLHRVSDLCGSGSGSLSHQNRKCDLRFRKWKRTASSYQVLMLLHLINSCWQDVDLGPKNFDIFISIEDNLTYEI